MGGADNKQSRLVTCSWLVVHAKERIGKHERGAGNGRVPSEMMTSEPRPKGGEGGIGGEKALRGEGTARAGVLKQKHEHLVGGNQGGQNECGRGRKAEGEVGAEFTGSLEGAPENPVRTRSPLRETGRGWLGVTSTSQVALARTAAGRAVCSDPGTGDAAATRKVALGVMRHGEVLGVSNMDTTGFVGA